MSSHSPVRVSDRVWRNERVRRRVSTTRSAHRSIPHVKRWTSATKGRKPNRGRTVVVRKSACKLFLLTRKSRKCARKISEKWDKRETLEEINLAPGRTKLPTNRSFSLRQCSKMRGKLSASVLLFRQVLMISSNTTFEMRKNYGTLHHDYRVRAHTDSSIFEPLFGSIRMSGNFFPLRILHQFHRMRYFNSIETYAILLLLTHPAKGN